MELLVGATGNLGKMVLNGLLSRGLSTKILVRNGSPYDELVKAGVVPVIGDLKRPVSLFEACRNVSTVITTANSALRGGVDNIETVDIQGNKNLIDAAKDSGVKHFIFISALGASPENPNPFFRAKWQTEQYLRESGMNFTIIAPTPFMEVWIPMVIGMPIGQGRPVTLMGEGTRRHPFISMRDVAAFIVKSVREPRVMNQYLPIGGPRTLTWKEIVKAYEEALGHPIETKFVPIGTPIAGLPEVVTGLMAGLESYDNDLDTRELAQALGVLQTPVEEFIRASTSRPQ